MTKKEEKPTDDEFIQLLEDGVRRVLDKKSKAENKEVLDAVEKGIRLVMAKHKLNTGDTDANFFGK